MDKARKRDFIKNGLMLTAAMLGMRTVSLFFNAFITREVGAEGVGLYTVIMSVYGFAVTFATSGISLTMTRLTAERIGVGRADEVRGVLFGGIIFALIFSLTAGLVLYFGAGFFARSVLDDIRCESSLRILAPSLLPLSLVSVFTGYFVGIRQVSRNATLQILGQLFKVGITVLLLLRVKDMGTEAAAAALALGTTLTELACFAVVLIQYLFDKAYKGRCRPELSSVVRGASPLAASAYVRQALLTLEHILIPRGLKKYGGDEAQALAAYGTLHGMALPTVIYPMAVLSSFAGLLVPEFAERRARGDGAGEKSLAKKSLEMTLRYGILASALLFVFSEELGYVIYSSREAGIYIGILSLVVPIMYLDHVTDAILKGIGEQVFSMWINITDSLLSIILVWLLIPKIGILGYAVAIIIMELYNFILSYIRLRTRICFRINILSSVGAPLLCATLGGLITRSLFLCAGAQVNAPWLVAELIFALCVYLGLSHLLSLILDKVREQRNKKISTI